MMFESFMETSDILYEIASEEGEVFGYEQTVSDEKDGEFEWDITITDNGAIIDEIMLKINYSKDPVTRPEMNDWIMRFEDLIECLDIFDSDDMEQKKNLIKNFDMKKWSRLIDIAEVEMTSKRTDYEPTGYGKAIALKLLRTRFKIIKGWINTYKPDVFLSKPKKENQDDTRRLRIYDLYFRNNLPEYEVHSKDMSKERVWFSTDILVCISKIINNRMLSALEAEVDSAIY